MSGGNVRAQGRASNCEIYDFTDIVETVPISRNVDGPLLQADANITFNPPIAVGASVTEEAFFLLPDGGRVPVDVTASRTTAQAGSLTLRTNGVFSHNPGNGDFLVTFEIGCDKKGDRFDDAIINIIPRSVANGESIIIQNSNPVTGYIRGPGAPALTLPFVGAFANNNNPNSSALQFDPASIIEFGWRGQNSISSNMFVVLKTIPKKIDFSVCDLLDVIDVKEINEGGGDVEPEVLNPNDPGVLTSNGDGTASFVPLAPPPVAQVCDGPFTGATNPTGWWQTWTDVVTTNLATETYIDWSREHQAITSPDCLTDFSFTMNVGNWYFRQRRNRIYVWLDWRILVNGTVALTRTNQVYRYSDERDEHANNGNAPAIPIEIENWGSFSGSRLNVPPGASIEVQTRVRWNVNGAQSDAYARLIGGLRSTLQWNFTPKTIVEDVT
jgi:hypothetical protein